MQTSVGGHVPGIPVHMQKWFGRAAVFAVFLLACLYLPATAATYTARVIAIADGDTLTVLDATNTQHKIRLAGIDAPEKRQAWGERARQFLGVRVHQRMVQIKVGKKDRYGREVGKVVLDGEDINLELIRSGLAWHYKAYEREQPPDERASYAQAERSARERGLGLWGDAHPVAPWDFRKGIRDAAAAL